MFILPFLALPILIIASMTTPRDIYYCVLHGAVLLAAFTVLACELLSLFSMYSFWPLTIYWLVVICASLFLSRKKFCKNFIYLWDMRPKKLVWQEWISISVLLFLACSTLAAVLIYPPTSNYDAINYHLPRVFYWFKNASVHNYPVNMYSVRQIAMGPLSSFFAVQSGVFLGGNDALAGFVQWFAYLGGIFTVAGISKQLGASRKAQFISAILVATIPMAILQSMTTQNDLFTGFWTLIVIYFIVYFVKNRPTFKDGIMWAVVAGLASGMVVLSKLSGVATIIPFAILFLIYYLRKDTIKAFITYASIVVVCVLVVCGGFFIRNAIDFDGDFLAIDIVGAGGPGSQTIQERFVATTMNLSRNFTFEKTAEITRNAIIRIADILNVRLDDDVIGYNRKVLADSPFDNTVGPRNEHDVATNPLQAIFLFSSFIILLIMRNKKNKFVFAYCSACIASYLLICASLVYSSSVSRYLLAISMAGMAVVPIVFEQGEIRKTVLTIALFVTVYYNAPLAVFKSSQAILIDYELAGEFKSHISDNNYSTLSRPDLRITTAKSRFRSIWDNAKFYKIIDKVKQYKKIGIEIWGEYPVIYNLRSKQYDVRHINPHYHSTKEAINFVPDVIVKGADAFNLDAKPDEIITYNSVNYTLDEHCGGIGLYIKVE